MLMLRKELMIIFFYYFLLSINCYYFKHIFYKTYFDKKSKILFFSNDPKQKIKMHASNFHEILPKNKTISTHPRQNHVRPNRQVAAPTPPPRCTAPPREIRKHTRFSLLFTNPASSSICKRYTKKKKANLVHAYTNASARESEVGIATPIPEKKGNLCCFETSSTYASGIGGGSTGQGEARCNHFLCAPPLLFFSCFFLSFFFFACFRA